MIEASPKTSILIRLIVWHFIEAPKAIVLAWKNFLVFNMRYFSVLQLLRTLLSPWRKYKDSYGRGFDAGRYLETFIGNIVSRLLGSVVRLVTIVVGLLMQIGVFLAGILLIIGWLLLPVFLIIFFAFSISILL